MPDMSVPEAVVVVTGPFEGAEVERWSSAIDDAMAVEPRHLVVDLAKCPALNAAAIVVLLSAHRAMVHSGGRLTLRGPVERVRRVLRLARVERVFNVSDARSAEVVRS